MSGWNKLALSDEAREGTGIGTGSVHYRLLEDGRLVIVVAPGLEPKEDE